VVRPPLLFISPPTDIGGLDQVSPTPTRTRLKKSRTVQNEQTSDISFVQETQVGDNSFFSTSVSRAGPTPTKGQKEGLFADDIDMDELQVPSPRHSMSETDHPETSIRRSKRRSTLSTTKTVEDRTSTSSAAIEALRNALGIVHATEMTVAEIAAIEDEVFEAFTKLRDKKRKAATK